MDPWRAWGELAERAWAHDLRAPGAEERSSVESLEEHEPGRYVWTRESVHAFAGGTLLFARAERRDTGPDVLTTIAAPDPDALVRAIRAEIGMTPGRVEVLGRAGIEIGLLPDDEIEGDELEGPIPE